MSTNQSRVHRALFIVAVSVSFGCASKRVTALPPLPEVPEYAKVHHPLGFDVADVRNLMRSPDVPSAEKLKGCEDPILKLRELSASPAEVEQGARELVSKDPDRYHWCFYSKLLSVHDKTSESSLWSERKKTVLEGYGVLVPIARAFREEYHDPRYLRTAIRTYRSISEWVFFRPLQLKPEMTAELMEDQKNPFGMWRRPTEQEGSVLEKYGITPLAPLTAPVPITTGTQAEVVPAVEPAKSSALSSPAQPADMPAELKDGVAKQTPQAPAEVKAEPVASEPAPSTEPVASEPAPSAEPVASEPAPSAEPVASEPTPSAEPVASEPAPSAEPVASEPAPPAEPVADVPTAEPPSTTPSETIEAAKSASSDTARAPASDAPAKGPTDPAADALPQLDTPSN